MNYSQIRKYDIANGEGIRTTLFVSGCKFHCTDCFNQEYQNFQHGKYFGEEVMFQMIQNLNDPNVDGLSILGGDPLWQDVNGLCQLIALCKDAHTLNKTVWLWSGFTWETIFSKIDTDEGLFRQELIRNVDIFVDGLFEKDLKNLNLHFRGSSNQRVIDVRKSLLYNKIVERTPNEQNHH